MCKIRLMIAVCILPLIFSACYDNREIDTVATVMAVGIEKAEGKNEKLYTFALSDTGSPGSDSSGDSSSLICCVQSAKDIGQAIFELDGKLSKSVSFSHLSAVFLSYETALEDMYEDISFFESDYKVRPQVIVAVTKISPRKYLEGLSPELEVNSEKYFRSVFQKSRSYGASLNLREFTDTYHCGETVPVSIVSGKPTDKKLKEEDASISSVGIIKEGKLQELDVNQQFLGLFFSKKDVMIDNTLVKSVKKPRTEIDISNENPKVVIELYVASGKKLNSQKLSREFEGFLTGCARKGIDVINVKKQALKEYYTLKGYEKANPQEKLKRTRFEVRIKELGEGEL